MYKISFYVPEAHKEQVKAAMFEQGAGQFDGYDQCAWEIKGKGQFRPIEGSEPFIGHCDILETVDEFRVEMICADSKVKNVLTAMLNAHPYEVPAYEVWPIMTIDDFS